LKAKSTLLLFSNPSIHPSIHPPIPQSINPAIQPSNPANPSINLAPVQSAQEQQRGASCRGGGCRGSAESGEASASGSRLSLIRFAARPLPHHPLHPLHSITLQPSTDRLALPPHSSLRQPTLYSTTTLSHPIQLVGCYEPRAATEAGSYASSLRSLSTASLSLSLSRFSETQTFISPTPIHRSSPDGCSYISARPSSRSSRWTSTPTSKTAVSSLN